jgi:hypothetical protein
MRDIGTAGGIATAGIATEKNAITPLTPFIFLSAGGG